MASGLVSMTTLLAAGTVVAAEHPTGAGGEAKRRRDRRRTAAPLDGRALLKKELQDVFYANKSHDVR